MDEIEKEFKKCMANTELIQGALKFSSVLTEDVVIGFGFYMGCQLRDVKLKKLRNAIVELEKHLDKTRRDTPWGVARYDMDAIIKEVLKE